MVVLHTTAGGFAGTVDWFGRAESGVSAHYLVGIDGRLVQFAAKQCPGNLDVERLIEGAQAARERWHEPARDSGAST